MARSSSLRFFDASGSAFEDKKAEASEVKKSDFESIVYHHIRLIEFNTFENLSDTELARQSLSKNTNDDVKARILSEMILRSVFDENMIFTEWLQTDEIKKQFPFLDECVKECQRVKARPTTFTPPDHLLTEEDHADMNTIEGDSLGPMYSRNINASYEKMELCQIDHRTLSLWELAAKNHRKQRFAGLQFGTETSRHICMEPTLGAKSKADFSFLKMTDADEASIARTAELRAIHGHTPVLIVNKKGSKDEYYIFGPKKPNDLLYGSEKEWELKPLLLDSKPAVQQYLSSKNDKSLLEEKEVMGIDGFKELIMPYYFTEGEKTRQKAKTELGIDPIIATAGVIGVVHPLTEERRVGNAFLAESTGCGRFLERSGQKYFLNLNMPPMTRIGFSVMSDGESHIQNNGFTARSTLHFNINNFNELLDMCALFYDIHYKSHYDTERNIFLSDRAYTYSFTRMSRALDKTLTKELFSSLSYFIDKEADLKEQDVHSADDYLKKWNKLRLDLSKNETHAKAQVELQRMMERTVYIAAGLETQSEAGYFWNCGSDNDIVVKCIQLAKDSGITLNMNEIPAEFKKTNMSALTFAVRKKDTKLVTTLVEHGAEIEPVLRWIIQNQNKIHEDVVFILLNAIVKRNDQKDQKSLDMLLETTNSTTRIVGGGQALREIRCKILLQLSMKEQNYDFATKIITQTPSLVMNQFGSNDQDLLEYTISQAHERQNTSASLLSYITLISALRYNTDLRTKDINIPEQLDQQIKDAIQKGVEKGKLAVERNKNRIFDSISEKFNEVPDGKLKDDLSKLIEKAKLISITDNQKKQYMKLADKKNHPLLLATSLAADLNDDKLFNNTLAQCLLYVTKDDSDDSKIALDSFMKYIPDLVAKGKSISSENLKSMDTLFTTELARILETKSSTASEWIYSSKIVDAFSALPLENLLIKLAESVSTQKQASELFYAAGKYQNAEVLQTLLAKIEFGKPEIEYCLYELIYHLSKIGGQVNDKTLSCAKMLLEKGANIRDMREDFNIKEEPDPLNVVMINILSRLFEEEQSNKDSQARASRPS